MGKTEILGIRDKFSKGKDTATSPWKEANDPELWMWKKTVLKQVAKLVPKNERIMRAIEYDNEGDTDFEEIARNDLKAKAQRPSEGSVLDLLPPTQTAPVVENPPAPTAPKQDLPQTANSNITPTQSKI